MDHGAYICWVRHRDGEVLLRTEDSNRKSIRSVLQAIAKGKVLLMNFGSTQKRVR